MYKEVHMLRGHSRLVRLTGLFTEGVQKKSAEVALMKLHFLSMRREWYKNKPPNIRRPLLGKNHSLSPFELRLLSVCAL